MLSLLLAWLSLTPALWAQSETKLTASDGGVFDEFGISVSLSGDVALVGADGDDDSGSAYVFRRVGGAWVEEAKLTPSDGAAGDIFGQSVSLSGDVALVGARWDDDNGDDSGSAYVFRRVDGAWVEEAKLTASDGAAFDGFGYALSVSEAVALVGAFRHDDNGLDSGSAYVFRRVDGAWVEEAELTPSDGTAEDNFGFSVSVSGDVALVGAYLDDDNGDGSGSAYVFRRVGDAWVEEAKLTASDGAGHDRFGFSVSASGDVALVGAREDDDNGLDSGSAYVFRRMGGAWVEEANLTPTDGGELDRFGQSVSVSGDVALVGAIQDNGLFIGSAYVFQRVDGAWVEEAKLTASDGAELDFLGFSVSVSGNAALAGARGDDDNGPDSGSAYVFSDVVTTAGESPPVVLPKQIDLAPNYPNPFTTTTILRFRLTTAADVRLEVYDRLGRRVATLVDASRSAGWHEATFDAAGLTSGVYTYRLTADGATQQRTMLLLD